MRSVQVCATQEFASQLKPHSCSFLDATCAKSSSWRKVQNVDQYSCGTYSDWDLISISQISSDHLFCINLCQKLGSYLPNVIPHLSWFIGLSPHQQLIVLSACECRNIDCLEHKLFRSRPVTVGLGTLSSLTIALSVRDSRGPMVICHNYHVCTNFKDQISVLASIG